MSTQNVEDTYILSPLQEGMLFHTIMDAGVGMYINQSVYTMDNVNLEAFQNAWQQVLDRHASLRTSFQWKEHDEPLQIVNENVDIVFESLDWSELSSTVQNTKLKKFLFEERKEGFDLSVAPLLRLSLIRINETTWYNIFSHHHIILDGWSGNIVMSEVKKCYDAACQGGQVNLPQPIPYGNYIRWFEKQDMLQVKSFWQDHLKGMSTPTHLPGDKGLHAKKHAEIKFGTWNIAIDEAVTEQLQNTAKKSRVTINTLILAAWAILLSRYSDESDVLFGVLVSGRPSTLDDVESIVGMFLNTIPFRVTVSSDMLLKDWLAELRYRQAELQEYEYSSLRTIQDWSEMPHCKELFGSMITRRDTSIPIEGSKKYKDPKQSKKTNIQQNYPFLIETSIQDELELIVTYDTDRFDAAAVARIMEQMRTGLERMNTGLESPVGDLSLLPHEEFNRIVNEWNNTQAVYPEKQCVHQLFEEQVKKTPTAIAVSFVDQQISYEEFNQQSNGLALYLRNIGINPGDLVGICIERSIEMTIALMATLKAGAAFVPLAPDFPKERLKYMLENSQAKALLTKEKWQDHCICDGVKVICLDKNDGLWHEQQDNLENLTSPEHLAYILYTSGSTGLPKGVAVPHRVPVNRIYAEHYPFQPDESIPVKTTLSFVDSLWEMFGAWLNGLTATLIPDSHVKDPAMLVNDLESCGATRLVFVPSLLRALFESEIDLSKKLSKLKHWISSGETLTVDLSETFAKILPNATLTNIYGTSEVWDVCRCDSDERSGGQAIPMGRLIKNMRAYILDDQLKHQPIGVPGELYVGGEGVAVGYLQRPDFTAERFIPDPYSLKPGKRMYKTGDRVRWQLDGNIEYLGRFDQQVKVRGYRIELGEVENVIAEYADVDQVAGDVRGGNLIVYLVPEVDLAEGLDIAQLKEFVSSRLPQYMHPTSYVVLEKFPLTPSGKVDRNSLPEPTADNIETSKDKNVFREPETELEKVIADVWSKVLKVDLIGLDDDFFDKGGHSLNAIRISARLTKALQKEIPLRGIFEAPTVAKLALWIESGKADQVAPELKHMEQYDKAVPLTYTQQRLWFLDQLNPGIASYTIPNVMSLNGLLNAEAIQKAFRDVVERHEILRTRFMSQDGEPYQIVDPTPDEIPIKMINLTRIPITKRVHEARRHARQQGVLPWNLAAGPLYRVQLISITPTEHLMSTSFHHIIADGQSMGIFKSEFGRLYNFYANGIPANLPELPIQYSDFALWEREVTSGDLYHTQLDYWRKTLDGAVPLELQTDHVRPLIHKFKGERVLFKVAATEAEKLRGLGKQEGCTTYMGMLAIFQLLLSRYSCQDDVIVGTAIWNRSRVELERLMGLFLNIIPMRIDFSGDPTFREVLARSRKCTLGAFAHMELPFEEMLKSVQVDRDLSHQGSPLFQIMFIQQPEMRTEQVSGDDQAVSEDSIGAGFSNFDLLLSTSDSTQGDISCTLAYDTELFEPETIERMVGHLRHLFEQAVTKPDEPVSRLSFLTDSEKQKVMESWSGNVCTVPVETRCVHEVIQQWANCEQDKQAVVFEATHLTYKELNCRSNQLARKLISSGVKTEDFVGLYIERSLEMIVGALGIMKSGGVIVPLDPAYPPDRIQFMIDDAHCSFVVCHTTLKDTIKDKAEHIICLDTDWAEIIKEPEDNLPNIAQPPNLAYVIFTSGSTGVPKGVQVEHRNLTNNIRSQIRAFGISKENRVLQTLSFSFDAAFGEVFRALVAGATLFLAKKETLLPGPELIEFLIKNKITTTGMSPTALGALPNESHKLTDLHTLVTGGEACSVSVAQQWGSGRSFIIGIGHTETTIGDTIAKNWDLNKKPPLGVPLENVKVYVLDDNLNPVPIGTPGELYVSGVGVSRGYMNRPDLTAANFIPNPFSLKQGERMYRTGDQVRWLASGELDFVGRIDFQVKIRGHRIELGEIESVLVKHDDIEQCAVTVSKANDINRLVAYVTLSGKNKPTPQEFRQYVKSKLPDYMVPALFMTLHSLPMTNNGKVDRKALPRPDFGELVTEAYVAPETEAECLITDIWASVLGIKKIGVNDNFFELGGDSISSIKVVARIAKAGCVVITPKDMFKYQTVAELSKVLAFENDDVSDDVCDDSDVKDVESLT